MARSQSKILKKLDSAFSSKKSASNIFDHSDIKNLMDDYKVSASNLIEICKDAYWEIGMWLVHQAFIRCPVDTGTMESSIYVKEISGRSISKFTMMLGYDPGVTYPPSRYKDGRTTGKVFDRIHELMWPEGGELMPSARSLAKGAAHGVITGGGFMRRAIDENADEIRTKIFEAMKKGIAEMGIQKKKHRYISKRGKLYRVGVDDDL